MIRLEDDAKGLRKYADMITTCYGVLRQLEKLGDLAYAEKISDLNVKDVEPFLLKSAYILN